MQKMSPAVDEILCSLSQLSNNVLTLIYWSTTQYTATILFLPQDFVKLLQMLQSPTYYYLENPILYKLINAVGTQACFNKHILIVKQFATLRNYWR